MAREQGGAVMTVVGVHGIAHEQLVPELIEPHWDAALKGALRKATKPDPPPPPPPFSLAFYGDLFPTQADEGMPVTMGPAGPETREDVSDISTEEVVFVEEAATEIPVDEFAPPAMGGFTAVPDALVPLVRRLCRRFDGWLVVAMVAELVQVHRYLADDDLAEQIRAQVEEKLDAGCRVLVGHSLGSVVAFETLALKKGFYVDTLITAGSPLSMRTVVNKLRASTPGTTSGLPVNVRRWVNVYDKHDPVAGAGAMCPLWPAAEDFEVNNGKDNPHSATRYLAKKCTGQAVLEALEG